jgi:hypothetical protein
MELFGKEDKPGVRGLPDNRILRVIPGKDSLFIRGKKHTRGEVSPQGDNISPAVFRGREMITVKFGEIGKMGVRA